MPRSSPLFFFSFFFFLFAAFRPACVSAQQQRRRQLSAHIVSRFGRVGALGRPVRSAVCTAPLPSASSCPASPHLALLCPVMTAPLALPCLLGQSTLRFFDSAAQPGSDGIIVRLDPRSCFTAAAALNRVLSGPFRYCPVAWPLCPCIGACSAHLHRVASVLPFLLRSSLIRHSVQSTHLTFLLHHHHFHRSVPSNHIVASALPALQTPE